MSEKIGRVIASGDSTASILEMGGDREVYRFSPREVEGNLREQDEDCLDAPARLMGLDVEFVTVGLSSKVISVSILAPVVTVIMCKDCYHKNTPAGAKICDCGNTTNGSFKHCEACAVEKRECAFCGTCLQ